MNLIPAVQRLKGSAPSGMWNTVLRCSPLSWGVSHLLLVGKLPDIMESSILPQVHVEPLFQASLRSLGHRGTNLFAGVNGQACDIFPRAAGITLPPAPLPVSSVHPCWAPGGCR